MFELKNYSQVDVEMQKIVLKELGKLGEYGKRVGATPTLVIKTANSCTVSVKHPKLSRSVKWNICRDCNVQETCYERICAVRVYPNGLVTPCLNSHVTFSGESVKDEITKAYELFAPCNLISEETCNELLDILQ